MRVFIHVLSGLVARDATTGQPYLRLPLPSEDVVRPLLGLLEGYLGTRR